MTKRAVRRPRMTKAVREQLGFICGFLEVNQYEESDLYAGMADDDPVRADVDACVAWIRGMATWAQQKSRSRK
jgi:hypothetical protein